MIHSKSNKHYLVIFQDEGNNLYYVGDYKKLNDSIRDLNEYIEPVCDGEFKLKKGDLVVYPSTFGECFDLDLSDFNEKLCGVMVRGFILDD